MALSADLLSQPAFRLTLVADPLAVRDGLVRIMASAPMAALSVDHRSTAEIVLAEALNNITEHAYADGTGPIAISLVATPAGLDCHIQDSGREMPGGSLPVGTLPEEELPEGGLGWSLIRSLTQGLSYQRKGGQNHTRFVIQA